MTSVLACALVAQYDHDLRVHRLSLRACNVDVK